MARSASSTPWRWAAARYPFVYEINAWPWLSELSEHSGERVELATVPEAEWDSIARAGFEAVWLMGVWTRSAAGLAVAMETPHLVDSFRAALPDWLPEDVIGSAYCIRGYEVAPVLGGRAGLAAARTALAARGIALILDFVPNHVAPDHEWTSTQPGFFVSGSAHDLSADPDSFVEVGGRVMANGRDPHFPAWRDVVQLNAFDPGLRAAMIDTLRDVAEQCDGVRCDMAMLVMNDVFTRTWGRRVGDPPAADYWPTMIDAVHRTHPGFTFLAEAYWDMEGLLQEQGFAFCYDKRLYDRLVDGDAAGVRDHLAAEPSFQNRLVRFVENHDEPRAAATFDIAREKAVAVTTLSQTGARLVHRGQLEGAKVRVPVFLGRGPREGVDAELQTFYQLLLDALSDSTFRTGVWRPCDTSGWPGDDSSGHLVAWCWEGDHRWLVIVNLGAVTTRAPVRTPWHDTRGRTYRLSDPTTGVSVVRSGDDLSDGLVVELGPWEWHLFRLDPIRQLD